VRKIIRVLVIGYAAYLAITLLLIMPVLNILPQWYVKQALDRELHTEIILFNPFTLTLEVHKAELPEHDGERFAGVGKAAVNLSLASLWQPGWVFDAVRVQGLYLHIRQLDADRYNFSDMLPTEEDEPPPQEPAGIPGITIHDFDFHAQQIVISNEAREKPASTHWENLAIRVKDLSTVLVEGKPYVIDAEGEGGGRLHWEGEVSIPLSKSSGSLALSNINLPVLWRFIEPWVNFELVDGRLDIAGNYQLNWKDAFDYQVTEGKLRIYDIDIAPKIAGTLADTGVKLADLTLAGINLDGPAQHVSLESVAVDGLDISGWSEDQQISLVDLFEVEVTADAAAPTQGNRETTIDSNDQEDTGAGWTAAVETIRMQQSSLRWRSGFTDPALLEVTPIEAEISNVQWPLQGESELALDLSVNKAATLGIGGILALADGTGKIAYNLESLPLAWFNPNFPKALKAAITRGQLQVKGDVSLAGYAPGVIRMDGAVTDFSGGLQDTEESLTSWETVRWERLEVDLNQRNVVLDKLSLDNYSGRIHIRKDGSINAQNVWVEELDLQSEDVPQASPAEQQEPWTISVPTIQFTDSSIDFMDESLPIVFRTVIGDLNGDIVGISTAAGAETRVDLTGSVDGYAPVKLAGTAEPFSTPPAMDLGLSFDGVDLALLTPYSGTYAGYAIDRGVLNLKLHYSLRDGRLQGNNKVVINQMKLGEKVDSDKALDIPLKLGLALLTDMNGVIDIQIPVSGNVDDPQFSVGSVVLGAFVNLISKAVTAPFNLLAGLVGSEEDLQRINFASGSAELNETGKTKLDQLSEAMSQRPALELVISGRLQPQGDRERLQKNALQAQLLAQGLSREELDSKGPAWENAIHKRYRELETAAADEITVREQYLQLAHAIEIPDSALEDLAEARAVAVKTYLVNEAQLDANRAVIDQAHLDDKANLFSGVELGVDT
jgi:Domain of Unknown Function (DUF748)